MRKQPRKSRSGFFRRKTKQEEDTIDTSRKTKKIAAAETDKSKSSSNDSFKNRPGSKKKKKDNLVASSATSVDRAMTMRANTMVSKNSTPTSSPNTDTMKYTLQESAVQIVRQCKELLAIISAANDNECMERVKHVLELSNQFVNEASKSCQNMYALSKILEQHSCINDAMAELLRERSKGKVNDDVLNQKIAYKVGYALKVIVEL